MANVLSQSEVEALLAALEPGTTGGAQFRAGSNRTDERSPKNSPGDFEDAQRLSNEQRRALRALHDAFSREITGALSDLLRTVVHVRLINAEQSPYSKFSVSLEPPTCFNVLKSEELQGRLILDLNPSIVFPMVDRLLGGGREPRQAYPNRPLTEIELRLVSRIIHEAIRGLERAWSSVCDLKLSLSQTVSDPHSLEVVPHDEIVLLTRFEITMGEMRGPMTLCLPIGTIEPLLESFSTDAPSAASERVGDPQQKSVRRETVRPGGDGGQQVEMVVQLAKTHLTAGDLRNLAVGDVILTETDCREGIPVLLKGRPAFLGHPGLYQGRKAVRLATPLGPLQDALPELSE